MDLREPLDIAAEALSRYKLRTALSVLGVVFGVAAVIAMMSVSEGARQEALKQVESLGLDNLVVRNRGLTVNEARGLAPRGLTAGDAAKLSALIPLAEAVSPLIERYGPISRAGKGSMARVLGVLSSYPTILRLGLSRGRFLSPLDERGGAHVCVLGEPLARALFGFSNPVGEHVRLQTSYYEVVGVLEEQGTGVQVAGALAWRDLNQAALVPLSALLGRSLDGDPDQHVDEIWLHTQGDHVEAVGVLLGRTLSGLHRGNRDFDIVIPRELLAQRYRTQQTFGVVLGSVAALSLLVGGIGIMNIMLTSVVERTHEIGVRRTVGATRRDVGLQFLTESLLMTVSGGVLGIAAGVAVSWGITAYAGWSTHTSLLAILLGFCVSFVVGLVFGLYPAMKASHLEPVDALRYE